MSIIYNGTTINNIYYGSTKLDKVIYNNVTVFQGIDPTKDSFSEEEFIAICNGGLQDKMKLGATIT